MNVRDLPEILLVRLPVAVVLGVVTLIGLVVCLPLWLCGKGTMQLLLRQIPLRALPPGAAAAGRTSERQNPAVFRSDNHCTRR